MILCPAERELSPMLCMYARVCSEVFNGQSSGINLMISHTA